MFALFAGVRFRVSRRVFADEERTTRLRLHPGPRRAGKTVAILGPVRAAETVVMRGEYQLNNRSCLNASVCRKRTVTLHAPETRVNFVRRLCRG